MKPNDLSDFEYLENGVSRVGSLGVVRHLKKNEKFYKRMFKSGSEDFYYLDVYLRDLSQAEQKYFWSIWNDAILKFKEKKLDFQIEDKISYDRIKKIYILFFLIVCVFSVVLIQLKQEPSPKASSSFSTIPKRINTNLYWNYTKEDFPRFYLLWGDDGVRKMSALERLVVQKVANTPSDCDEIAIVGLNENKSTPKKNMHFYVDCENGVRIEVNEKDLPTLDLEGINEILKDDKNYID